MTSKKINIWELGEEIGVKINLTFIDLINDKIEEMFGTKRQVHKQLNVHHQIPFSTFKDMIKRGYRYFIDLDVLLNLCKMLKIPSSDLQSNIIAYKVKRGHNYIEKPKLPIEITPVFDMLVAHHIGDGNVVNPEGRKPYFAYRQFNDTYRNLYIKKIEHVFGSLNYENKYFNNNNTTRIYFPVAGSHLMFNLYGFDVNGFKSETARIPRAILKKNWKHQLSFLTGLIIDEGTIDSDLIAICMKNENLIKDLKKICDNLHYETSLKKGKNGMTRLYILSGSLEKFYEDYNTLLLEFPEVGLGYKGEKIKQFIDRMDNPKVYIKGNKNKILRKLSKRDLTANEISTELKITRQGARYLLNELVKENKIKIKSKIKFGAFKYGVR